MLINKFKTFLKVIRAAISPKIFCISSQRTGTTSVGQFFNNHNYRVATYGISKKKKWTLKWFKGEYGNIFSSWTFKLHQVFEDDPWWCTDFYKVLFHRFPSSKFVLVTRNADDWFNSMVKHSSGKTLGITHIHANIYQRMEEFYKLNLEKSNSYTSKVDNLMELDESHRKHYTGLYELRILEIKRFFELFGKDRIVIVKLEDSQKWQKIGAFFNIEVATDYEVHANKS